MARTGPALLLAAVLGLAYWALAPGLNGGFQFDDYANLPALGEYGGVHDARTLALFLTSGMGDPIGRPLSLLSFLVDARSWPADPSSFLRTNITLHFANATLLLWVLFRLGQTREMPHRHALTAAIVGAGIWLLHPLYLSTTLYIVQREAMLPAGFTLIGMLAWLAGRSRLLAGKTTTGYLLLATGSLGCTILASLCKANGVLLPLLLLVTETTLLAHCAVPVSPRFAQARRLLLGLPIAVVALALTWNLPGWIEGTGTIRPWSLAQRLLTEPRVLLDYLALLAFPRPITSGVFHDNFAASTDWLHPATTLPALVVIVAFVLAAWRLRQRWPVVAFAVLFFFAGHLLESSVIPLELYFEHRNYLPAMMLFWPLAVWLTAPTVPMRSVRRATVLLIIGVLAWDTHLGARTWGQPEQLAFAWAAHNPDSPRAQAYAAQYEIANGAYAAAERRLAAAFAEHPEQTQLAFNLADAQCGRGRIESALVAAIEHAIERDASAARLDFSWLRDAVARAREGSCQGFDLAMVEALLQAAHRNPNFAGAPGREQDFNHLEGLIELASSDVEGALAAFNRAASALPRPDIALTQSALLASAGRPDLGLRHLDEFFAAHPLLPVRFGLSPPQLHAWLLDHYGYWRDEVDRMRGLLAQASREPQNANHSDTPPSLLPFHDG